MSKPKIAVFRPSDSRIEEAAQYLRAQNVFPIADSMLQVRSTGMTPRIADYCIFTSKTGVEIAVKQGWRPDGSILCAVGRKTEAALVQHGYLVDIVPSTFTSQGLIEELSDEVDGQCVEVARSAHGSDVLIGGLKDLGGDVHETQLYRLNRPDTAGRSVPLALADELDGILFTSPKTVEHFVEIANEQASSIDLQQGLRRTVVGAIGGPTKRTVERSKMTVDVTPEKVCFELLADRVVQKILSN